MPKHLAPVLVAEVREKERSSLPMSQMYVIHVMRWGTMEKTISEGV